jgi:triacylglycerol lipase
VVVLLHGLGRTRISMAYAAYRLASAGYTVHNIGYPSRQSPLEQLAQRVSDELYAERGVDRDARPHYLTHSMGGLVLRVGVASGIIPAPDRVVMLSPPNQGSHVAWRLRAYRIFGAVLGPAAKQLARGPDGVAATLGPPPFQLGVITGTRGINPYLTSTGHPHDGLVSVEEARIDGMADFLTVPYGHTFVMNRSRVLRQAMWFFEHGRFRHGEG